MTINEIRNEIQGLCMTCNHAGTCNYLAGASSTIWCCEEFDDRAPLIVPKENLRANRSQLTAETDGAVELYAKRQMRKVS